MIVVSGCPRSGTSLMMQILRSALGEDAIYGTQFPQDKHAESRKAKLPRETEAQYEYRQYAMGLDPGRDLAESHDLNPDGFWECPFTVRGISYRPELERELENALEAGDGLVCKVVSEALAHSEPRYVDRVVLMARHPRAVAKSQERLLRELRMKFSDGKIRDLYEGQVVHSPEMFIESTVAVMRWLAAHPTIPVLVVCYDDLIAHPEETVQLVSHFVDPDGDWKAGAREVKVQLKRSYPEDKKSLFWEDAEYLYDALLRLDHAAVKRFMEDDTRAIHRERRTWMCVRCEQPMNAAHCRTCTFSPGFRAQLRKHAEVNGVPWRERPCAYEVAYSDGALKTIEASVRDNSWVEEVARCGT